MIYYLRTNIKLHNYVIGIINIHRRNDRYDA